MGQNPSALWANIRFSRTLCAACGLYVEARSTRDLDSRSWCSARVLCLTLLHSSGAPIGARAPDGRAGHNRSHATSDRGGMSVLSDNLSTDPQRLSTGAPRPAVARTPGDSPYRGPPLSMRKSLLRPPNFCRESDRGGWAFRPQDGAVAGPTSSSRSCARRRSRSSAGSSSCDSDQPGHVAAVGVGALATSSGRNAACSRDRRLGMAARPSLRHGARGFGDE